MTQDPQRLTDDPAGSELARALREAQGNLLSREAVERVRAGLLASGIATPNAGPEGGGPGAQHSPLTRVAPKPLSWVSKGFTATTLKVGLAALGVALLVGAASRLRSPGNERPSPTPAPAIVSAPSTPTGEAAPPVMIRDSAEPLVTEVTPPAAPRPPPASAPLRTAEPARTKASPAQASVPSSREGALLLEARRMLDTDPAQALALVRVHQKEFPESQLALERARIAAEAQRRSGQ